jgi:two-component system, LytTR family, sensor histidine kinase AlgZ
MHPILENRRGFGLYAIAWLPLAVLLAYLLRATGLSTKEAIVLVVPLAPFYAVMCLAAWFPCRATPIPKTGFVRLATTHINAAALLSSVWMFVAMGYAVALEKMDAGYSAAMGEPAHFPGLGHHSGLYKTIFGVGILLYLLAAAMQYVLLAVQRSREAEQRETEARLLARDAELRALKAQVNPHFLFNSLHSISALTTVDPRKAREMCITLADFLRKTLGLGEKELIPLDDELALLRGFLTVEKIRFGNRLQLSEQIEEGSLKCLVPPLLLQPLVENAITHGIANLPDGGSIEIAASCDDGYLRLSISNSFDLNYQPKRGVGIGIANVRERLAARYGKDATFEGSISGDCYLVRLTLPLGEAHYDYGEDPCDLGR